MTTNQAARASLAYVEALNAKDLPSLLRLFAPDARLTHPFGTFTGRQELGEFYGNLVMAADTKLTVHRSVVEGRTAVIEVSAVSPMAPDMAQYAIDLFEVNENGEVVDLCIYYRNFDLG